MDTFFAMDTQRAVIQTMESLYILATSKNIETIKGRYAFLLTLIPTLKSAKNNSQYSKVIQSAFGQFNTMYPTSVPQEYQLSVIHNPETFDINEFYCSSLVKATKRYYDKQLEEINALKKETAKTKRVAKVIDSIKLVQNELQLTCSASESYPTANVELDKLLSALG
jgi:hypothetical protein